MELKQLVAYSISSLSFITLLHHLFKIVRRKQLLKSYFRNKVILITGASSGLGAALAEELFPLGAQLILCARRLDELNKVKEKLLNLKVKNNYQPEVICLDVTDPLDIVTKKLNEVMTKLGCVDILINNAGVSFRGECFSTSDEVFKKIMEVNYFGLIRLTNQIVKHMIDETKKCVKANYKSDFSIVMVGSVQSLISVPYRAAYSASKHALLAYSDALRSELHAYKNINVLSTYPGYINTNVSINALRDDGTKNSINDDDHIDGYCPNYVAKVIIDGIIDHKKELFISVLLHRFAVWLRFFLPNVYHHFMLKRAQKKSKSKYI